MLWMMPERGCMGLMERSWNERFLWQMVNSEKALSSLSTIQRVISMLGNSKVWQRFWRNEDIRMPRKRRHSVGRNLLIVLRDQWPAAVAEYFTMSQILRISTLFLKLMQKRGDSKSCSSQSFTVNWTLLNSAGDMQSNITKYSHLHLRKMTLNKMLSSLWMKCQWSRCVGAFIWLRSLINHNLTSINGNLKVCNMFYKVYECISHGTKWHTSSLGSEEILGTQNNSGRYFGPVW
jgi:hypothetical protein